MSGTVDLATLLIQRGLTDQSKDNMSAIVVALPGAPAFAAAVAGAAAGSTGSK